VKLRVHPGIEKLVPYDPGKPIEELQREMGLERVIKLASNENALGPSPKALEVLKKALPEIHRYPDGSCYYLKHKAARKLGVSSQHLIFGNGSNEVIELLMRTYLRPGDKVVYGEPAFVVYKLISLAMDIEGVGVPLKHLTHDLEAMAQAVDERTKMVFVANPNNPTGTMVSHREVMNFLERIPQEVIVVFDEAYIEFVENEGFPQLIPLVLEEKRPLVLMRTFSKIYGLAGLRIGYGIAPTQMVDYMNRVRQPFNVNSLAQAAALAALDDDEHVERSRTLVREGKAFLYKEMEKMGLEYVPSETNFFLIKVGDGDRVFKELLKKGVIVRNMGGYGLPEYIRVTLGTGEENVFFLEALKEVLETLEE